MKLPFLILTFCLCESLCHKSVNAKPQLVSNGVVEHNQAAGLMTQPVTINSYWNNAPKANLESYFDISNPECKKINPLDYLKNPESFLKQCGDANNSNQRIYEPVEYLKVPPLDSGIKIKLSDF
jgi:hypothetical protein